MLLLTTGYKKTSDPVLILWKNWDKDAAHVLGSAVSKNLLASFSLKHTPKEGQNCVVILDTEWGMSEDTSVSHARDSKVDGDAQPDI